MAKEPFPSQAPGAVPLPLSLRRLLQRVPVAERNPGLQLDKYLVPCPTQKEQRLALLEVLRARGDAGLLADVLGRQEALMRGGLDAGHAVRWNRTTGGPLTLHLARAAATENAGLCLHRVYGFAYLPGSGLKGMSRAYATTVWLPGLPPAEQAAGTARIERVFGNGPGEPDEAKQKAGAVVFHDAWPQTWPELALDICNNHHDGYYQKPQPDPPGDWHEPTPVYFLAVKSGQAFTFTLSRRRPDDGPELLDQAREWLDGALTLLGCGAKTAAGYGGFQDPDKVPATPANRATFEATLELATPAFLAGAEQGQDDCTLRPATLRGLLRWWWRTLHVGFVDVATLRALEAAVWGDTSTGGPIRLTVEPLPGPAPAPCPMKMVTKNKQGKEVLRFSHHFRDEHGILPTQGNLTPGVMYHSFGMDEMEAGRPETRKRRWYAPPRSRWRLRLLVRDGAFPLLNGKTSQPIDRSILLDQAKAALWWFCKLGGAGSKSRKGFGSFVDPPELATFEGHKWKTLGRALRQHAGVAERDFDPSTAQSPNLHQMIALSRELLKEHAWLTVATSWDDPWRVLDEVGSSAQAFAQAPTPTRHGKHCPEKLGLGLPRKIDKAPARELRGVRGDRHASPVFYHVGRESGRLVVRVCAFPSSELREPSVSATEGLKRNQKLLSALLGHLQQDLTERLQE